MFSFFDYPITKGAGLSMLYIPLMIGFTGAALVETPVPIQKSIMLNVNVPENRGTISALIQTSAQLGFGAGAFLISRYGTSLAEFLNLEHTTMFDFKFASLLWIVTAISWIIILFTMKRDEERVKDILTKRSKIMERKN